MRSFNREELARYDGKNAPAYIAFGSKVFDVSESFLWKDGRYQVFHSAGEDLTDSLPDAPHTTKQLEKFPVVGILK